MHAGVYQSDRYHYMNRAPSPGYLALATVFDGTYYLTQSGTPDRPIVIKGAGDGEVVFDGDGAENLFNLMAANYNYFEGITVRNTNVAFLLGIKSIAGASGFTLKHSRSDERGPRRAGRLVGVEELLHRRQRVHRPPRSGQDDGVERRHLGEAAGLPRAARLGVRR